MLQSSIFVIYDVKHKCQIKPLVKEVRNVGIKMMYTVQKLKQDNEAMIYFGIVKKSRNNNYIIYEYSMCIVQYACIYHFKKLFFSIANTY